MALWCGSFLFYFFALGGGGAVAESEPLEEPIGFGILSTAFIARTVSWAIAEAEGSRLVAVGSRDLATAAAFAAEYGEPSTVGLEGYDAVLRRADVQVVYIPLPTALR